MNCGTPALDKLGTVPWEKPGERSAYPSILNELTFEQKVVCFFFFFLASRVSIPVASGVFGF